MSMDSCLLHAFVDVVGVVAVGANSSIEGSGRDLGNDLLPAKETASALEFYEALVS